MPDDDDDDDNYEGQSERGGGGSRFTDPPTTVIAAGIVDARTRLHDVLRYMYLMNGKPRNAWETADNVGQPTNTISPRFCSLRRQDAIVLDAERRAGPTGVGQQAYTITEKGRQISRGEIELQLTPPPKPWERKKWLRQCLWRAINEGWTIELQDEVLRGFDTYPPTWDDWDVGEDGENGGEETP